MFDYKPQELKLKVKRWKIPKDTDCIILEFPKDMPNDQYLEVSKQIRDFCEIEEVKTPLFTVRGIKVNLVRRRKNVNSIGKNRGRDRKSRNRNAISRSKTKRITTRKKSN